MTSQPIKNVEAIKRFYNNPREVESYLAKRIGEPFNSVLHMQQVAFVRRTIRRLQPARVLDLAPGPARLSAEISVPGLGVATDASLNMLLEARRRIESHGTVWELALGNGYHLPFASASFDLVYSLRFVRRFDGAHRRLLYQEITRVLKPGGSFIMDAQNRAVALPHRIARGLEKYPVYDELFLRSDLITELEGNGFRVSQIEGMMRRFTLQFRLNRLRHVRLSGVARLLIRALECTNDRNPSTWMVLCTRR
jgi:ubiquinone/menaquinone biosynthesis C-methylase UbiE